MDNDKLTLVLTSQLEFNMQIMSLILALATKDGSYTPDVSKELKLLMEKNTATLRSVVAFVADLNSGA